MTLDRQTTPGRAAAHFEWSITSADTAGSPSATPSLNTTPAPIVSHPANHSVSPRPGPNPADPAGATPANPAVCVAPPDPDWADRLGEVVTQTLRAIVAVTVLGIRDGIYLIVLLLLLLLFLLLHRLVDRRDPKLALAPLANNRYAYLPDDGELRYLPTRIIGTLRRAIPMAGAGNDDENNGGADG